MTVSVLWFAALGRGKKENLSLLKLGGDERKYSEEDAGEVGSLLQFCLYAGEG